MSIQRLDSPELLREIKLINHPSVGEKRIATFDAEKAYPAKRMLSVEMSDFSFTDQTYYSHSSNESDSSSGSDSESESESSTDENGNEMNSNFGQVIYSDVFLSSSDLSAQQKLNCLNKESVNVCDFELNASDSFEAQALNCVDMHTVLLQQQDDENALHQDSPLNLFNEQLAHDKLCDESLFNTLDEQGNLIITRKDQESESELHTQTSDGITASEQVPADFGRVHAYKDNNGKKRGICSKCRIDKAINFHWKLPDQLCAHCRLKSRSMGVCSKCKKSGNDKREIIVYHLGKVDQLCSNCRRKDTRVDVCSKCKKNGDNRKKIILYHCGQKDQLCSNCRTKETRMGVCSRCRDERGDNSLKIINFHHRKPDQLCSACRKQDTNMGTCSICGKYQFMNFHNKKPDQMCKACRIKTKKLAQSPEEISQEE